MKDKETEVMISLEQEDMRVYREDGKVNTTIGYVVLKVSFVRYLAIIQTT